MPTDDEAVTPIVATVLLVALFAIAAILFMNNIYPDMVAKSELAHRDQVAGSMAELEANLENSGAEAQSHSLDLAAPAKMLDDTPTTARLMAGSEATWSLQGNGAVVFGRNGRYAADPTEVVTGAPIRYVARVDGFSINFTSGSLGVFGQNYVNVTADDGYKSVTISVMHTGTAGGGGCKERALVASVLDGVSQVNRIIGCNVAAQFNNYTIDVLNLVPEARQELDSLDDGYTLVITVGTVGGQVSARYGLVYQDTFGSLHTLGGAQKQNLSLRAESTCLTAETEYLELQVDGVETCLGPIMSTSGRSSWFLTRPKVQIRIDGDVGFLSWEVLELETRGMSAGQGFSQLSFAQTATTRLQARIDTGQICISGAGYAAWGNYLKGLEEEVGHPDAYVESFGTQACLHLDEQVVTNWSLDITIHHVEVQIQ
jgi:hypothetical protein